MGKMKVNVVILVLISCGFVLCQRNNRSVPRNANGTKSGRSISGGETSGNNVNYKGSPDSIFDDSPVDQDSSKITFGFDELEEPSPNPVKENEPKRKALVKPKVNQSNWKSIPLNDLVKLGKEVDVSLFLRKYVRNAKVALDENTLEEYLVDKEDGVPISNSRNEKVIVTPGRSMLTMPPYLDTMRQGGPPKPSFRTGVLTPASLPEIAVRSMGKPKQRPITLPVCSPENTTVDVPIRAPPHMIIIPRCVRVERCGGCCLSDIMACEPDAMEKAKFHIKKLAYIGGDGPSFEYVDDEVVEVWRHTKCKCKCKKKKEDCYPHQIYVEDKCSCECKDPLEYQACQKKDNTVWDPDSCMCGCKEPRECSSGTYFDYNTCACEQTRQG